MPRDEARVGEPRGRPRRGFSRRDVLLALVMALLLLAAALACIGLDGSSVRSLYSLP